MPDRLRVFLVGVTADDASALRALLARSGSFEVVGLAPLADVRGGVTVIPPDVDAVVMTPRALQRPTIVVEDPPVLVEHLTPRERTVLGLVADGLPNREIARELDITEHTVKFHLASVFGKLGASSRTDAVRRGLRLGLIEI